MKMMHNYIDGSHQPACNGGKMDVVEPATAATYAQVADSCAADINHAVEAAANAYPAWQALGSHGRSACLLRLARALHDRRDAFAAAESMDNGKPVRLAASVDIPRAVQNLEFFATAILHDTGDFHHTDHPKHPALNYTLRQPLGVVGCISPWNLPLYLFTWKIAPALAAGNTVVAKPSEVTPRTAFMLSELCREIEMPPGVLNIVHGHGAGAGDALVRHPDVKAISFTGGTTTGQYIATAVAPQFKKLSLELGGKNPNIIFEDADIDRALKTSVRGAFANQGQICLCGSRIFVQRSIYKTFFDKFVRATGQLVVGDPMHEHSHMGALVSKEHLLKVQAAIDLAREEGGEIALGGTRPVDLPQRCHAGYFLQPTIITHLDQNTRTNREEIFGPVVTICPFNDEKQVVEMANDTRYGLSASIWTSSIDRAHRVAASIDAGTVWVNCWLLRDLRVPFGGMKDSGLGREGGQEALRFFTEPKNICIAL